MSAVFSAIKPGFALLPSSGLQLYPPGLVCAILFGEGGGVGLVTGDSITWDSVNNVPFTANTGNIATGWISGRGGYALNLGSTGQINGTSRKIDPLTWVGWVKIPSGVASTILAKNDGNTVNAGWEWNVQATPGIGITIEHSVTNLQAATTNVPSDWLGQWHHVAIIWDGTTTAANTKIYIDGILRALTTSVNGSGTHGSDSGNIFRMGYDVGGGSGFFGANFNGAIESIFLFNTQLQASDIHSLFRASYRWFDTSRITSTPGSSLSATLADDLNAAPWKDDISFIGGNPNFQTAFGDNLDSPWSDAIVIIPAVGTSSVDDLNAAPWQDAQSVIPGIPIQAFDVDDQWADSISTFVANLLTLVVADDGSANWQDSVVIALPVVLAIADILVMYDPVLEIVLDLGMTFSDSMTLADVMTSLLTIVLLAADTMSMSDSAVVEDDRKSPFTDSFKLVDSQAQLQMGIALSLGDAL